MKYNTLGIWSCLAMTTVTASAQIGGGVTVPEVGTWLPTTVTPDLRPMVYIHTWNGDDANDLRLSSWWYDNDLADPPVAPIDLKDADGLSTPNGIPDVFDELLRQFNDCYDRGFRRIIMNLPAGNPQPGQLMASSQWHTMPTWRKNAFTTVVKPWIDAKAAAGDPVNVGVYAGFLVRDPDTFYLGDYYPSPNYPGLIDTTSLSIMSKFLQNIEPWIDVGMEEYWLDDASTSTNWATAITIQSSPDYDGIIRFGGEAIPSTNVGVCQAYATSNTSLDYMPWTNNFNLAEYRHRNEVIDSTVHEVHLRLTGHRTKISEIACTTEPVDYVWNMEDAIHYYENGFVLDNDLGYSDKRLSREFLEYPDRLTAEYFAPGHGGNSYSTEAVQRIYGFGPITSLADFNGDGVMEVAASTDADYAFYLTRYASHYGQPGLHSFIDGDINGDHVVNSADLALFAAAASQWVNFGTVVPVDLGDPEWVP